MLHLYGPPKLGTYGHHAHRAQQACCLPHSAGHRPTGLLALTQKAVAFGARPTACHALQAFILPTACYALQASSLKETPRQ